MFSFVYFFCTDPGVQKAAWLAPTTITTVNMIARSDDNHCFQF